MADEIDYDALDQALRGAIRHEKQPKAPSRKKVTSEAKPKSTPEKPKSTAKTVPVRRRSTAPRGHYMDMVSASRPTASPRRVRSVSNAQRPRVRRPASQTRQAPAQTPSGITAPAAAQSVPLVPIAYTQDGTPIVYTQPGAPQVTQTVPTPAPQAPAPTPVVAPSNENIPVEANPAPAPVPAAPEGAPLGARSPYMVNTQVDKRPLSNDVKEGINQIYGQPEAQLETANQKESEPKQKKKEKEKKESSLDWKWILTMIIVVIAGAIAGYLFYILFADKLPF